MSEALASMRKTIATQRLGREPESDDAGTPAGTRDDRDEPLSPNVLRAAAEQCDEAPAASAAYRKPRTATDLPSTSSTNAG